jgi:hypothetical protein
LPDQGAKQFSSNSDRKSAIVEPFNNTLRARIYKYLRAANTRRYIALLADMVHSCNHSRHRAIGRKPSDVITQKDCDVVWRRVYYDSKEAKLLRAVAYATNTGSVARVGGLARLSRWKGTFEKGYVPNWGREQFRVVDTRPQRRGGMPRPHIDSKACSARTLKARTIQRRDNQCQ